MKCDTQPWLYDFFLIYLIQPLKVNDKFITEIYWWHLSLNHCKQNERSKIIAVSSDAVPSVQRKKKTWISTQFCVFFTIIFTLDNTNCKRKTHFHSSHLRFDNFAAAAFHTRSLRVISPIAVQTGRTRAIFLRARLRAHLMFPRQSWEAVNRQIFSWFQFDFTVRKRFNVQTSHSLAAKLEQSRTMACIRFVVKKEMS